jgi:hypothetical protein
MVQADSENMSYYGEKEVDDASLLVALKNMQHHVPQPTNRPQLEYVVKNVLRRQSSTI